MAIEQKDVLFTLVKSLSKSEKRQFKLYVGRLGGNADANFISLFNLLDKVSAFNDDLILKNTKNNALFFDYLGNDTLRKNPPINFFKKFNLEEEGEHKGKFDIKNSAFQHVSHVQQRVVTAKRGSGTAGQGRAA